MSLHDDGQTLGDLADEIEMSHTLRSEILDTADDANAEEAALFLQAARHLVETADGLALLFGLPVACREPAWRAVRDRPCRPRRTRPYGSIDPSRAD